MNKNDFAPTPPMGWNSYDYYDTTVTEEDVMRNADYMAANLKSHGWEYIVVDIQWYAHDAGTRRAEYQYIPFSKLEMDEYSRLLPDPNRFPSSANGAGFAPLAEYVHNLGLKFGIHIMRGIPRCAATNHGAIKGTNVLASDAADPSNICPWNPDMYGLKNIPAAQCYYDSLLELYASWGVDFIKCDDICRYDAPTAGHEIEMLYKAIQKCGRPIVLSLSPGPARIEKAWHYEKYANMWRITDDFWDDFTMLKNMFYRCELWQTHVSKGCYPDCDMLPMGMVGKGFGAARKTNFTYEEQKTMMTLWCLFGSPLMLGAEMPLLDEETLGLLTNDRVLAMLPPNCIPTQVVRDDNQAIWKAVCEETGKRYVALFNLSDKERIVASTLDEIGFSDTSVTLEELWSGEKSAAVGSISAMLKPHACHVYEVHYL